MLHLISETTAPSADWISLLAKGGSVGVLASIVLAFVKGWIVPGSSFREVCEQRDRAIDQIYRLADQAQQRAEFADRKAGL